MRTNPVLRALTVLGLGAIGLVGGHATGYAISVPDVHHRTALLEATGHAYLPSASRLAVMLGVAALVAGVTSGYLHGHRAGRMPFWRSAAALGALQCTGFIALEVAERILAGAPLATLSLSLVLIGLATQAVVGIALALLIVGLRRLGTLLRVSAAVVRPAPDERVVGGTLPALPVRTCSRTRVRGPPVVQMV